MTNHLPFARLAQLGEFLDAEYRQEQRDRWRELAFIGWQHYVAQPSFSDKPEPKKSFGEYLDLLHLADPADCITPTEDDAELAARLIAQAQQWLVTADPGRFARTQQHRETRKGS